MFPTSQIRSSLGNQLRNSILRKNLSVLHLPQTSPKDFVKQHIDTRQHYVKLASGNVLAGLDLVPSGGRRSNSLSLKPEQLTAVVNEAIVRHNKPALKHILTQPGNELEFSPELSSRVLQFLATQTNEQELSHFRQLLLQHPSQRANFQLSTGDVNKAIAVCLKRGEVSEALNWFLTARDALRLEPDQAAFDLLVAALGREAKWDEMTHLLGEMRFGGFELGSTVVEAVVSGAAVRPAGRWREVVRTLKTADHALVTSQTLKSGLSVLLKAHQPSAVKQVHSAVEGLPAASEDEVVPPLCLAAIALKDDALFCRVLRRNAASNGASRVLFDDSSIAPGSAAAYAHLVVHDSLALLDLRGPAKCGNQLGVAVLWMLLNGKTELAVHLWNSLVQGLIGEVAAAQRRKSPAAESDLVGATLNQVMAVVSQAVDCATSDLATHRTNTRLSAFLNGALFNVSSDTAAAGLSAESLTTEAVAALSDSVDGQASAKTLEAVLSVDMELSEEVAHELLGVFLHLQDGRAAFELLSRCLKHNVAVAERTINDVFDLLVADGDHQLVLDLSDFYIKQQDDEFAAQRLALAGRQPTEALAKRIGLASRAKVAPQQVRPSQRGFSPYVYTVAMRSLLALGEVDTILQLLRQEIPAKGFFPANSCYEVAVQALQQAGRHGEAVQLFKDAVDQRAQFIKVNNAMKSTGSGADNRLRLLREDPTAAVPKKIHFSNYTSAADSPYNNDDMVLRVLSSCAHAGLGVDALQISSAREQNAVNGLEPGLDLHRRRTEISELVIRSIANKKFVRILPEFLDALAQLKEPFSPSLHTMQLTAAVAVYSQDAQTVRQVLERLRAYSFSVSKDLSRAEMIELLRAAVPSLDEAAVAEIEAFAAASEELAGMQ